MSTILIASDAWLPQINGVVRTLVNTKRELEAMGHKVEVIHPHQFFNLPCPVYPEIKLAFAGRSKVASLIKQASPDYIHIATEGPIGKAVSYYARKRSIKFTTSFHTLFPDYLQKMLGVPSAISWNVLRNFHKHAECTMVPGLSIKKRLESLGFNNIVCWSRGIDSSQFYPREKTEPDEQRPIIMYVGRVSKEKNIESFLSLKTRGIKYVVGDGPIRKKLEKAYPEAVFVGYKQGDALAEAYSNADVMVFPSRTDTFGNVILESLACGTPVAAYPVTGPIDIIVDRQLGALNENLARAIEEALHHGNRQACADYATSFTWRSCTETFVSYLQKIEKSDTMTSSFIDY